MVCVCAFTWGEIGKDRVGRTVFYTLWLTPGIALPDSQPTYAPV